ncbi:MAG: ABC transporter ATP-binding protein [Candidatus Binataceae bacterium]
MLKAAAITKRFSLTLALDRVDFDARAGEIHALLGENGAGKTTLMNVLAGTLRPDSGVASLDGVALTAGSPHAALRAGIAAVHQSPLLFERMSWEENLALGGFGAERFRLDIAGVIDRSAAQARKLGFELPPNGALIEERSVGERVRLEVLRALSFNPRVLILDEPTSLLAPHELAGFLELLRRLKAEGRIVVLITHKLAEARAVADRVTVLRQGKVVMRTTPAESSVADLARAMIGELVAAARPRQSATQADAAALSIESLTLNDGHRNVVDRITLSVARGEIVGIAGVDGNGQTELVELLAGVRMATAGRARADAGERGGGLAVIPQDRDLDGLVLDMTLWENLLLAAALRERTSKRGWLDRRAAQSMCAELLARYRIGAREAAATAGALSGGNRQRFSVARAVRCQPRVIVAHNITRGLDLRATADVHGALLDFAAEGGAVLLISSDLDELLAVCGRLYVMNRGRLRAPAAGERNPERLGLMMAGTGE